jgi:hypothetical protein
MCVLTQTSATKTTNNSTRTNRPYCTSQRSTRKTNIRVTSAIGSLAGRIVNDDDHASRRPNIAKYHNVQRAPSRNSTTTTKITHERVWFSQHKLSSLPSGSCPRRQIITFPSTRLENYLSRPRLTTTGVPAPRALCQARIT